MVDLLAPAFITAFLVAAIAAAMPLILASVGETIGEQSGVLNLGIEGSMLVGAYSAFVVTLMTGNFWLGMLAGGLGGAISSIIMLVFNVWLGLNQIVIGLAVTLLGEGITSVLYDQNYSKSSPRLGAAPELTIPWLSDIPILGPALFKQSAIFWACVAIIALAAWFLSRTNWGLSIRAAGQKPSALDSAGGSVRRTRSQSVLISGALVGLGGGYLALLSTGAFTPFITNGLGFVAIVIAMLGRGRIAWVCIASLIYGLAVAVGTALQLTDLNVPIDVVKMLPFIVVMITLILFARSASVPPAMGIPYTRGAR